MTNFLRFASIIVLGGSITWACSGDGATQSSTNNSGSSGDLSTGSAGAIDHGGSGGSGTTTGSGGSAGSSSTSGSSGGAGGSSSGSGGSGGSGVAGSSSGASGAGGASVSALGCSKDTDCIVAYAHSNKGCCFRGCGSAFNKDYVAADPCVSANEMTDPVPASCDTGCLQCPASHCQDVYGAVCLMGQCTSVTQYGPCAVDEDCVVATDYSSDQGGCCSCSEITNKLVLADNKCIVAKGQPKPDGCAPTADQCKSLGCPAQCPSFGALKCVKGACMGS
jgi:hypothetical protein